MANKVDNPRFPHNVEILEELKDENGNILLDDNADPIIEVVFESKCGLRDMVRGKDTEVVVFKSDYKLAIPKTSYLIKALSTVRFTHADTGEIIEGKVEAYRAFNLGCTIWIQSNGNG